jgi:hypothetical protein
VVACGLILLVELWWQIAKAVLFVAVLYLAWSNVLEVFRGSATSGLEDRGAPRPRRSPA